MVLNKEIVKLLIVYIVVAAVLCLVDFGGGAFGINRFAWRLGLKAFDFNNIVGLSPTVLPSISALAVYVVIGILVAFGLSYIYPNFTLKTEEKENKENSLRNKKRNTRDAK